ncbi:MAG: hypothetical protein KDB35_14775 [Acidimicrobiales bacterium]|nr:hypothetical protein [Acidimicrobiales bacterium]MCB1016392.1 hypothetical protein [Acidimicrobiales bacterium]
MSSHGSLRHGAKIAAAALATVLGIGLLAFGGGSSTAGAARAATEPSPYAGRIGINSHSFWLGADDATRQFRALMAGGVTSTREDIDWDHTEPSRGNFDWSRSDNMFTAAARTGIDVLGVLDYSASWASSQPGNPRVMPANDTDFARFAAAVVSRYGPGGQFWAQHPELSPQPLRAVEIWNEPWGYWTWVGEPSAARYARLARAAATSIRNANADVDILISADLLEARRDGRIVGWIDGVLAADPGLVDLIDAYSIHPYHYGGPRDVRSDQRWDYGKVALIRQVTAQHGANKPMWITEVGWTTAPGADGHVSEATQATYTRQAVVRAFDEWPYVKRFYLYSYDRDSGNTSDREGYFGVRRQDGSYKPAWTALTNLLADRVVTTTTTAPPTTTPPTTAPPTTTSTTAPPTTQRAVLAPARLAVRILGRVFYYDPAPA